MQTRTVLDVRLLVVTKEVWPKEKAKARLDFLGEIPPNFEH